MPKCLKNAAALSSPPAGLYPPRAFVAAVIDVVAAPPLAEYVQQPISGIDVVTLAGTVVLLWRACATKGDMANPTTVLAGVWLRLKYDDHPSCADDFLEWYVAHHQGPGGAMANKESSRRLLTDRLSRAALRLWQRAGMRMVITSDDIQAVRPLVEPAWRRLRVPPRVAQLPAMWLQMRRWIGIRTPACAPPTVAPDANTTTRATAATPAGSDAARRM